MGTTDFLLLVIMGAVGVLCSIGGGLMIAVSDNHRRVARIAFILAGLLFWTIGVIWSINAMSSPLSIRLAVAGIVGAASAMFTVWMVTLTINAQTPPPVSPPNPTNGPVIGLDVMGNGQGGPALKIQSSGSPGAPSVGGEVTVRVPPGQSAVGTRVIQTDPGTGIRVIQTGPGVGFRSTVTVGPDGKN